MLKQRHEKQLGCALTDAFTALVDVVAKGRWGGSALVSARPLPHAGLPVRAATRQGLRRGKVLACLRPVSITLQETLLDPPCCVKLAPALAHRAEGRRRVRAARRALLVERRRRVAPPALVRAHPRSLCANARCARSARRASRRNVKPFADSARNRLYTRSKRHALPSCAAAQRRGCGRRCLRAPTDRVHAVASLQEFFKDSVATAMAKQGVAADDHTAYYVVNLLTLFARQETLYDRGKPGPGLQPLALLLAAAAESPNRETRNAMLRRVGDTSLFVAGFLGDGFARKLIDVDYYIDMGGAAYGRLVGQRARHARRARIRRASSRSSPRSSAISSTCSPRSAIRARPPRSTCCGSTRSGCARAAAARRGCCASTASSRTPR